MGVEFGLTDFAEILFKWSTELSDFWSFIIGTSAYDFLIDIEGKLLLTVIGTPVSFVISAYINLVNLFNNGYLMYTTVLEWMLGGMLRLFVGITVVSWIHDRLYRVLSPLE